MGTIAQPVNCAAKKTANAPHLGRRLARNATTATAPVASLSPCAKPTNCSLRTPANTIGAKNVHPKIDVSQFTPVAGNIGPNPQIGFVPLDKLIIDESYQRAIDTRGWSNIRKIADSFDWSKFSPLMVAARDDGTFAIIDGQHRAHAAALRGVTEVPALISQLTSQQQASAFSWINGTVSSLTPNQIFKAALTAFEPWAVQCDAVVTRAGCKLMPHNKSTKAKQPGEVFPITLVRKIVNAGNAEYLCAVLEGVRHSTVSDDIRYYNQHGISALVPAAIEAGVNRSEIITAFLTDHNLADTEKRVLRLMQQPEYRTKSFAALFAKSVMVLMKNHASRPAVDNAGHP